MKRELFIKGDIEQVGNGFIVQLDVELPTAREVAATGDGRIRSGIGSADTTTDALVGALQDLIRTIQRG